MSSDGLVTAAASLRIAQRCGFFRLRRASRVVAKRIEAAFENEELSPHQLFILLGLQLTEGARLRDLADLLGLDHSTLSRTIAPLVARGWIREAAGPADARTTPLELTDSGRREATKAARAWERFQSELEGSLGEARWTRLARDLDAVIALDVAETPPSKPRRSRSADKREMKKRPK
ncbi:MAG TPA: MarR family winged helix-turn-helix transcriptional regulator [Polyangia bacterium]|nr:MarR family winged helix-turn-helix transcriptional regulator [Polyangia bacterium]